MYAQFQQKDQRDLARYQHALETLLTAEIEAKALIGDLKSMLELLLEKLNEKLRLQAAKANAQEQDAPDNGKGKEKKKEEEIQDEDFARRNAITHRLRETEILLHKVTFLMGDVYHTLGEKYSKEEEEAYGRAELIRKKLLKGELLTFASIVPC